MGKMDICKRVSHTFVNSVLNENVQIDNAFEALKILVLIVDGFNNLSGQDKKSIVIKTLEDLTAGKDNILYTDDDILPRHIIDGIRLLIDTNMISSTIDLVCEATHAKATYRLSCFVCRVISYLCGDVVAHAKRKTY